MAPATVAKASNLSAFLSCTISFQNANSVTVINTMTFISVVVAFKKVNIRTIINATIVPIAQCANLSMCLFRYFIIIRDY